MGFFKGLKNAVGGGDDGGGGSGPLAKMAHANPESQGANQGQYTYDPNTQQFKTMKNGGTASSRADGCCVKGKTKGRMI